MPVETSRQADPRATHPVLKLTEVGRGASTHGMRVRIGCMLVLSLALGCGPRLPDPPPAASTGRARPSVSAPTVPEEVQASVQGCPVSAGEALGQGSKRLLRTLKHEMHVGLYASPATEVEEDFACHLVALLREYEREGKGNFVLTVIDPNTRPLRDEARNKGLKELKGNSAAEPDAEARFLGLAFSYKGKQAALPALHPPDTLQLEFWITTKLRELRDTTDGIQQRVGVIGDLLTEENLVPPRPGRDGPSLDRILRDAFPFYRLETVSLEDGVEIDQGFVGIVMTQPRSTFKEQALRAIDSFLMRGGKTLAVYASAVNLRAHDETLEAALDTHGLNRLLESYGVRMNRDAVLDFGAHFQTLVLREGGGTRSLGHPGVVRVSGTEEGGNSSRRDRGFPGFFALDDVMFPFPSSLTLLTRESLGDVRITPLARTTPQASVEASSTVSMKLRDDWQPSLPLAQKTIAVLAEGELPSAFSHRRAPMPSRVLVVSSSLFLANPFAHAGNPPNGTSSGGGNPFMQRVAQAYAEQNLTTTILCFKNTLDWMVGYADLPEASR